MKRWNKGAILAEVQRQTGYDSETVRAVADGLLNHIKNVLITEKDIVEIRGFGTFLCKKRKGKQNARNPKTGVPVIVKPHGTVQFKPGKDLKAGVRAWDTDDAETSGA